MTAKSIASAHPNLRKAPVPLEYRSHRRLPEPGRKACELLRTLGTLTILVGVGAAWMYGMATYPPRILVGLGTVVIGLLYLACGWRIALGRRTAGFVALSVAGVQAGAAMIVSAMVAFDILDWEWLLRHPPVTFGLVRDTPPNWAFDWVVLVSALAFAIALVVLIRHLSRFLKFGTRPD